MKAVIALVLALALLAIGIPLSRAISDGEEHTITRTVDPVQPSAEQPGPAAAAVSRSNTGAAPTTSATPTAPAPTPR